ncbi:hypothetical protein [Desulfoplanes sp.]
MNEVRACATAPQQSTDTDTREMSFVFPPSFSGFNGHFPDRPILPAMVQIMAGILTAGNGSPMKLLRMGRTKFMRIVQPGETMTAVARISLQDDTVRADVRLSIGDEPCASFPLFLEPPESAL